MWCTCSSTAYRKYRASLARGNTLFFHVIRWQELDTYFRRAVLGTAYGYCVELITPARACARPLPPPYWRGILPTAGAASLAGCSLTFPGSFAACRTRGGFPAH